VQDGEQYSGFKQLTAGAARSVAAGRGSFEAPNHTQTPNTLFDVYLPLMGGAELKVTLAICRKTFGWHQKEDRLSFRSCGSSRASRSSRSSTASRQGIDARHDRASAGGPIRGPTRSSSTGS
jgi:hypothetical protein